MDTTTTPDVSQKSSRPTHSCTRCISRKVKCDRQKPCTACSKHNVECVFNCLPPPRRRQKRARDQIMEDRLLHYEELLRKQGIDPDHLPKEPELQTEADQSGSLRNIAKISTKPNGSFTKTQMFNGQGDPQFVHNSLYTRVVEELQDPSDDQEHHIADEVDALNDDFNFILGSSNGPDIRSSHPSPEHGNQLLEVFIENVDPLTKIIHVPSLRPAFTRAMVDPKVVPKTFETLLFAIYGAAIVSLDDEDCQKKFSTSRHVLLSRYILATKSALCQVNFMATTSLVVLQAFVLNLLTVRDDYEPRAVWSLTGIAVRIAEQMGVDRDGSSFGLSVFESEMRRRIWWALKTHDFRTAELCGLPKFRDLNTGLNSAKFPTNINDDDLFPGCSALVPRTEGLTDAAFLALRYEMLDFAAKRVTEFRAKGTGPDQWDLHASAVSKEKVDEASRGLEQLIETKYLRYCDPCQPLHLMVMLMARFSLNIIQFLSNHPRRWASLEQTPAAERQRVWEISIKLLEQHSMVQSNPLLKRFAWHAPYFQQWHAFIHVLDVLRSDPFVTNAHKAWELIGNIYQNIPDMISDTRKPIHLAVGNLCLKAYSKREAILPNEGNVAPEYILLLRQQRESMKAKRQAREADKIKAPQHVDNILGHDYGARNLESSAVSTTIRTVNTDIPSPNCTESVNQDDRFWQASEFDDQANNFDIGMDLDMDFMLAQDFTMENDPFPDINWDQWDTWLADSNLLSSVPQA